MRFSGLTQNNWLCKPALGLTPLGMQRENMSCLFPGAQGEAVVLGMDTCMLLTTALHRENQDFLR